MTRLAKQVLYGGFYLALVALVLWRGYRAFVPAPTCSDGIQNQMEEGVDCGAVCGKSCAAPVQALMSSAVQLIHNTDGSWDALIHLENPNGSYGAAQVPYTLTVSAADGSVVAVQHGQTYVNPAQPQYQVVPLGVLTQAPMTALLQLSLPDIQWGSLTIDAAGSVTFAVRNDALTTTDTSTHVEATLTNNSDFDFDQVDVTVLVYDASGAVVAGGSTIAKTVVAHETRAFTVDWPFAISGATRAQAFVETNVFDNANFNRTYGSQERFQSF